MEKIDLNGTWSVVQSGAEGPIPATVPGCVHADLLTAGRIEDPYYRDIEDRVQWIGEADWEFSREFTVEPAFLEHECIELDCHGLDTFAVVMVNGTEVARTDNMFRRWRIDVKDALKEGVNAITVRFESTLPYIRKMQAEHPLHTVGIDHKIDGGQWVRKEQCNYGWDWGPQLVTCGIWRDIALVGTRHPVIADVRADQHHHADGSVELDVRVSLEGPGQTDPCQLKISLLDGQSLVAEETLALESAPCRLRVDHPRLWWPAGMGGQPLYTLQVELLGGSEVLDTRSQSVGLRRLELVRETDQWGESFKFRANGRDFFAKGANWIPADTFDARVDHAKLRDLLESAVWANMNCIRVWGGGLYERDDFYDLCDELGLVVWQDFMFACSAYPAHDTGFMENVRVEAIENVRRLRHHPSILLWCGNNELEQIGGVIGDGPEEMRWHHYCDLFDKLLKDVVEAEDGQRPYWPSSEHSPIGNRVGPNPDGRPASQDPRWGDAHLWDVWHRLQPFEWYRTSYHRFCSEFGFQSFPHPKTVEGFTAPEDRNITSYVMEKHQRSPIGNAAILHYMLSWFQMPVGNVNTVWASQLLQALAIKYAVEHWRRNMPRCMGALYWQLNDCWPAASWASIDSEHRWKALHYAARRFFAPVLVSGMEEPEKRTVRVHLSSDLAAPLTARLEAKWIRMSGEAVSLFSDSVELPVNGSIKVTELDLGSCLEADGERGGVVYLRLMDGEGLLSDNVVHFRKPKHLEQHLPDVRAEWSKDADGYPKVTLTTDKPSLWTWPHAEAYPDLRWSDSFFALMPGHPKTIRLVGGGDGVSATELSDSVRWLTLDALWCD